MYGHGIHIKIHCQKDPFTEYFFYFNNQFRFSLSFKSNKPKFVAQNVKNQSGLFSNVLLTSEGKIKLSRSFTNGVPIKISSSSYKFSFNGK